MFLFDADKAANGGIFRELWAHCQKFCNDLRIAACGGNHCFAFGA